MAGVLAEAGPLTVHAGAVACEPRGAERAGGGGAGPCACEEKAPVAAVAERRAPEDGDSPPAASAKRGRSRSPSQSAGARGRSRSTDRCAGHAAADAAEPFGGPAGCDRDGCERAAVVQRVTSSTGAAPPAFLHPPSPRNANRSPRRRARCDALAPAGAAAPAVLRQLSATAPPLPDAQAAAARLSCSADASAAPHPHTGNAGNAGAPDAEMRSADGEEAPEQRPAPRAAASPKSAALAAAVPLRCGAFAARGARPYMEDRHVVVSPFGAGGAAEATFIGVYDGHNGAHAAEHAAQHLHLLLAADPALAGPGAVADAAPDAATAAARDASANGNDSGGAARAGTLGSDGAVADALVRAFLAVDAQILAASAAGGTREGATALVALRLGSALFTAHAGDSRGVAAVNGRAARLTRDHTPACAHEAARVRQRGGHLEFAGCWRVVAPPPRGPPRPRAALAVTRALGDLSFKHPTPVITAQPDVGRLELTRAVSFIVLATDGLWDVLSDQDAVDIGAAALAARQGITAAAEAAGSAAAAATAERSARAMASALVNTALQRGSSDNVTCVVLLPQWPAELL